MSLPRYDESSWPLVRVTAPQDPASDEEFDEHLEQITRYHARAQAEGSQLTLLVDVREAPPMPVGHRRQMGERMSALTKEYPQRLAGMAMVVDTNVQRGVITAISWVFSPPYPFKVFTNLQNAAGWLRTRASHFGQAQDRP